MRFFFFISDNVDTQVGGCVLAGIEGVVVHEAQEVRLALEKPMLPRTLPSS